MPLIEGYLEYHKNAEFWGPIADHVYYEKILCRQSGHRLVIIVKD